MKKENITAKTLWFKEETADGKELGNVEGRFIEQEVLDIYNSKVAGKEIYATAISCQIKVIGSEVKDMVSHQILDKDEKSENLKKRFPKAWARFVEIRGSAASIENDSDIDTDNEEVSTKPTPKKREAKPKK
ncbi:MAG: hypothetical protein FWC85_02270 [Elusimicrobia bacterium]|nr:hypothetical protein [Elusimicrobiota bacterium]